MSNILGNKTDTEIMLLIGERLRGYRLQQNLSVAEVARRAGINPNTVLNAEAGRNPRFETLIRILRVYDRIDALNAFLPKPKVSPIDLARTHGKIRKRARSR